LKGLIVTADDFGAAREVNDAIEEAHRAGILTSASLMVASADAIARAHAYLVGIGLPWCCGGTASSARRCRTHPTDETAGCVQIWRLGSS
jgi:hypothetical protein